jgi:hypothetical protein
VFGLLKFLAAVVMVAAGGIINQFLWSLFPIPFLNRFLIRVNHIGYFNGILILLGHYLPICHPTPLINKVDTTSEKAKTPKKGQSSSPRSPTSSISST